MERENFYILLNLPVDPPETDPKIIEAAIAAKQAEWSRLRNHPSKGLQAQKYINMIPEIRRVMANAGLREKEARAAREHFLRDKESKYPAIDSNLEILLGKGFVTKEEIVKLAQIHDLPESEIQSRVKAKKDEKFGKIDQQIRLRMAKGYLTEAEITRLAKRHNLKIEEVKLRIHCPVRKNEKGGSDLSLRQMDRSIEKTLKENLKILGKASLYDFLGIPEGASLENLQDAAAAKKKELAAIGRKDADLTAGNTLAGHCVTIFKTEESRIAYDVSLARSKLAELDSDIDISGVNGRIRSEYHEILVKKAMDFGMEKEEAERYIRDYCRRKKWSIEIPPDKKRRKLVFGVIAAALIFLSTGGGWMFLNAHKAEARRSAFADLLSRVEQEASPESRVGILQQYIRSHQGQAEFSEFVEEARKRIDQHHVSRAETAFREMKGRIDELSQSGSFEAAQAEIESYLKSNPPETYAQKAASEASGLDQKIEERDFQTVSRVMIEGDAGEKIEAIGLYLQAHPRGAHADAVKQMRNDMSNEYFIFVRNRLAELEAASNWSGCAELARSYIELYDNSHSDQLRQQVETYNTRIRQDRIFAALKEKADELGDDHGAAIRMYRDYLAAYPDAPFAGRINTEIGNLEARMQAKAVAETEEQLGQLFQQTAGRFVRKVEGTVVDTRTGLTWTLLDSSVTLPDACLSFEQAESWVRELTTGGHSDWRLPTSAELTALYKQAPYFPALEEKWYWTSNSYSSYSDGWKKIIDTVSTIPGDGKIERRDSHECGAVRAVRGR